MQNSQGCPDSASVPEFGHEAARRAAGISQFRLVDAESDLHRAIDQFPPTSYFKSTMKILTHVGNLNLTISKQDCEWTRYESTRDYSRGPPAIKKANQWPVTRSTNNSKGRWTRMSQTLYDISPVGFLPNINSNPVSVLFTQSLKLRCVRTFSVTVPVFSIQLSERRRKCRLTKCIDNRKKMRFASGTVLTRFPLEWWASNQHLSRMRWDRKAKD